MNESKLVKDIVSEVKRVAEKLNVDASLLTKAQFFGNTKLVKEWDVRKVGGFASILKTYFPPTNRDLLAIEYNKQRSSYVSQLERQVARMDLFHKKMVASMAEVMAKATIDARPLDKKATAAYLKSVKTEDRSGTHRSVCTVWSDQHFGTNVESNEMNGINEFNWKIGARRLAMLCEQIATFKIEKRHLHDELVIFLLGDNIAGVIHNQEGPHNDLSIYQIAGTLSYYIQAINYLKSFYPKVRVLCQPGNHGRVMHKESKDRAMQQKFDSLENYIFAALSAVFQADSKVTVEASKTPYIDTTVRGHRIFATHGDTVFDVGNPGKTVPLNKIAHQVSVINSEAGNRPYEMFLTGHVHHPVYTHVGKGIKVIVNGCLIGTDPYALSVGIANSQPAQALWESTDKYVQGDIRSIYVGDADQEAKYDKIIKPYNYEIVFPKII
jgi:hypothetical protein